MVVSTMEARITEVSTMEAYITVVSTMEARITEELTSITIGVAIVAGPSLESRVRQVLEVVRVIFLL